MKDSNHVQRITIRMHKTLEAFRMFGETEQIFLSIDTTESHVPRSAIHLVV